MRNENINWNLFFVFELVPKAMGNVGMLMWHVYAYAASYMPHPLRIDESTTLRIHQCLENVHHEKQRYHVLEIVSCIY